MLKTSFSYSSKSRGFTLLELMITVFIVAILVAVAAPSFNNLINSNRIDSVRSILVTSFKMARSEAVFKNTPVTICASTNQAACSGTGNWNQGWIIFQDANANGTVDAGDVVVDVNYGNADIAIGAGAATASITYAANGMNASGAATIGICDPSDKVEAKAVIIQVTGSLGLGGDDDAAC